MKSRWVAGLVLIATLGVLVMGISIFLQWRLKPVPREDQMSQKDQETDARVRASFAAQAMMETFGATLEALGPGTEPGRGGLTLDGAHAVLA